MDDIIIRGGLVVDGSGEPGFRADVAVKDGRIRAIGDLSGEKAARELDASGLAVAPGFFDAHCHSDTTFLLDSSGAAKLYQGVTTEVCGQCGFSPFPALPEHLGEVDPGEGVDQSWYCASFRDFAKKVEDGGWQMGVNLAPLTGHGSLRAGVLGYANRAVTDEELRSMQELLRQDLEAGVWGLSLGLEYSPGCFADQKEFAALGRVLKEYDAFLPAHLRNEGEKLPQAIDELLSVGRETGVHVHISHLKLDNYRVHGTAPAIWKRIADAKASGVNVTADMYPYDACCTYLNNRCPKWVLEGGNGAVEQVLATVSASGLEGRVFPVEGDLRRLPASLAPGSFDLVVCNPPYFRGSPSPDPARAAARTEISCSLEEVCAAAARLLRFGGRFCVCQRPERLPELFAAMAARNLTPKRLRLAADTVSTPPWLALVEGRLGGRPGLRAEPLFAARHPDGTPTQEMNALYQKARTL